MKWLSNSGMNKPMFSGTAFLCENYNIEIHRCNCCSNDWFLSCSDLGINHKKLKSTEFNNAVEESKTVVAERIKYLASAFDKFINNKSETYISRC